MNKSKNYILVGILIWFGLLITILYFPINKRNVEYDNVNNNSYISISGKDNKFTNLSAVVKTLKVNTLQSNENKFTVESTPNNNTSFKNTIKNVSSIVNNHTNGVGYEKTTTIFNNYGSNSKKYSESRSILTNNAGYTETYAAISSLVKTQVSTAYQLSNVKGLFGSVLSNSTKGLDNNAAESEIFSNSPITLAGSQPQKANGLVDPGQGDPVPDPIPVPDGTVYMIVLIAIYTSYKLIANNTTRIRV